jgi:hypothetical protein
MSHLGRTFKFSNWAESMQCHAYYMHTHIPCALAYGIESLVYRIFWPRLTLIPLWSGIPNDRKGEDDE